MPEMTAHQYQVVRAFFVMKGGYSRVTAAGVPQLCLKTSMIDSFVNRVVEWFKLEDRVAPRDHDDMLVELRVATRDDTMIFSEEQFHAFAKRIVEKGRQ